MNFQNKNILITGASSGIGKALAIKLANDNCNLLLVSRRLIILEQLKNELIHTKCKIFIYKCDVSIKAEVNNVCNQIFNDAKSIDIAILNAGVSFRNNILDFDSTKAENTFWTNYFGIIYFVEKLIPHFILKKKGMIVGISSLADVRGFPESGFYCSSKSAVTSYLESIRIELKKFNIKVVTVRPGFIKTPMTDKNEFNMPFLMNVEKSAKIIFMGIKKEKKIIQFPWQMVLITKLLKVIPNFLFDFLASINIKKK